MSIDTIFPPESGVLLLPTFFQFTYPDPISEDNLYNDLLRIVITAIALPIFSYIGIIYNILFGLLKIPLHLFIRDNRTLYFQVQIRTHFSFALIDSLISYFSSLRYMYVFLHFLYPIEMLEKINTLKKTFNQNVDKIYIDPRLKI